MQAVAAAKKAKRDLTQDEKDLVARVTAAANILVQVIPTLNIDIFTSYGHIMQLIFHPFSQFQLLKS